ncbi:MAG TPA: hypothetical protein VJP86_04625 [Vicinamibacterales bacterium]|nr:hypothetical protein [Vicinamibacterales bacterium]
MMRCSSAAVARLCAAAATAVFLGVILRGAGSVALSVQGRASANVSIAASGTTVVAVWSASTPNGAADIYAAVSRDGGQRFGSPVRVNSVPGQANVNGEQPPRISLAVDPSGKVALMTVVWTAKGENGTRILSAQSRDGGRTFSRSADVPGSTASGNRGWQAITSDANGRTSVVWLDHRGLVEDAATMAVKHHEMSHQHAEPGVTDGVAMAQRSHLYYAAVGDAASVRGLAGGVCYCCKTAIALGPAGAVSLAWRHVYPGNLRDIAFSISRDGGKTFGTPVRISEDQWHLEGCPDDGPAMVVDSKSRTHIVWPTLVTDAASKTATIGLFYTTSSDAARFAPRVRVPTEGVPHHPQLALGGAGPLLTWDELLGGKRQIAVAQLTTGADGRAIFKRQIVSSGEPSIYPSIASTAGGAVIAWTSGAPSESVIRVAQVQP